MKTSVIALAAASVSSLAAQSVTIQQWNFTENGSGIASLVSEQGLGTGFFATGNTEVASDGGYTVNRGNGSSGDTLFGLSLTDANTSSVTLSVTLRSFDFSTGTTDTSFSVRLRNDASNVAYGDISFTKQDANNRIRLTGTAVGGVALSGKSRATPITYGLTLDFVNDTYTYWIGTPSSGAGTWVSRFSAYTGSVSSLGLVAVDSLQWSISSQTSGNVFVLDQVDLSYVPLAVPEPSSFAAVAGLGALGFVATRRRRA